MTFEGLSIGQLQFDLPWYFVLWLWLTVPIVYVPLISCLLLLLVWIRRRRTTQNGFEVKLNSDGMSEEQKKENDHG